jgi:hypothetical protein
MRRSRVRVTTLWLMGLVALVAINFEGVRAMIALRAQGSERCAAAAGNLFDMADGRILLQPGRKGTVYLQVRPATGGGLCRTCWPVGASVGLTVLSSALACRRRCPIESNPLR